MAPKEIPKVGRLRRMLGSLQPKLRLVVAIGLLLLLGSGIHQLWHLLAPTVSRHPQYLIGVEQIEVSPRPDWIRSDVKSEVLRDANLAGAVSILDDPSELQKRIREAFEFHPWIAAVERIEMRLPASVLVELRYRKPVAAVERPTDLRVELLAIDAIGVRLPDEDFTDLEKRYLPRIVGPADPPLVGQNWNDARVTDAAELATAFADQWNELDLYKIRTTPETSRQHDNQPPLFELITRGGTRIIWGAAPGKEPAGESPWAEKLSRLTDFAARNGKLGSIEGPAIVDVRQELSVTPRTATKSSRTVVE
jgi:hypothetical protein